jgi:tRNA-dihydrouridine synthase A
VPTQQLKPDRRVCVAPMMDWTDRHCRFFLRGFNAAALLYTEMINCEALLRGDAARFLRHSPEEQPLALQLGGNDPARLAAAARLGEQAGYREVNLNCGCPSDRVRSGTFGACLMADPGRVADCVAAMRAAVSVPVTVKMRVGILEGGPGLRERIATYTSDDYARLADFTSRVAAGGCEVFIVHARQAVLGGLSPKENRDVPPLHVEVVQQLARDFPRLDIVLNGGLRTAAQCLEALGWCRGVMLGREAYHRPYVLWELQRALGRPGDVRPDERSLLLRMADYAEAEIAGGERLPSIARHMLGLLAGRSGATAYRRRLSEGAREGGAGAALLRQLAAEIPDFHAESGT